mgnify:CR=1 FL=1
MSSIGGVDTPSASPAAPALQHIADVVFERLQQAVAQLAIVIDGRHSRHERLTARRALAGLATAAFDPYPEALGTRARAETDDAPDTSTPSDSAADRVAFSAAERGALARAVATLLIRWGLGPDEACRLLGGIDRARWHRLADGGRDGQGGDAGEALTPEAALRAAHLVAVHALLKQIFGDF